MASADVNERQYFPYHFVDFEIHHLVVEELNFYSFQVEILKMGSYSIKTYC